jgi:16S rRNA (guanine966-N2)-methyltransferase
VRIVGGKHRGRGLDSPPDVAVRPTSDRAREALFNILEHGKLTRGGLSPVRDARVLDAFCGTGALGLESLSRGAAFATFIDTSTEALRLAQTNAKKLGEAGHARFLQADATRPPRADASCNLAFLDPPYGDGLAAPTLAALAAAGWLAEDAIVVVESATRDDLLPPAGFTKVDERRYGKAKLSLLLYRGAERPRP